MYSMSPLSLFKKANLNIVSCVSIIANLLALSPYRHARRTRRKITMGQNQSAEGKPYKSKDNIDELVDEVSSTSVKKHAKHELYISNTDLENGGDIDSLLQGIGYTPSESEGRFLFSHSFHHVELSPMSISEEVISTEGMHAQHEALMNTIMERAYRFIRRTFCLSRF